MLGWNNSEPSRLQLTVRHLPLHRDWIRVFEARMYDITHFSFVNLPNPRQEKKLNMMQRYVVGGGTEPPFTGRYSNGFKYNTKRPGTYNCAVCGLPAYSSRHKFESGTGWPSFYEVRRRERPMYC